MKICFLDTETTSLRHDRRAWDIGIIAREYFPGWMIGTEQKPYTDVEHQWFIDSDDLDLGNADLISLKIGKFYERHPEARVDRELQFSDVHEELDVLGQIEIITRGAYIVGAVPNFDTEVIGARMRAHGLCPSWHYHLIDVENLAAGQLRMPPPWSFDTVLETFGLVYDETDRHTALGDARMAMRLYDTIMAKP